MSRDESRERRVNRILIFAFIGGLVAITLYRVGVGPVRPPPRPLELSGDTMGTRYRVQLAVPLSPEREEELERAIATELRTIIDQMSTYEPSSEVSRFNAHRSTEPFPVSRATARVVSDSLEVSRRSGGAFDVTVGPLVDAWGFGPPGRPPSPPPEDEVSRLRDRVGHEKLRVSLDPPALTKLHPEVAIDLSAIAKGYAVDRLAEIVEVMGSERYLVEIGGDVRANGLNANGEAWRLGVEEPTREERSIRDVVAIDGSALATSGNYRNSYEVDGVRYVHTLDPRSGAPVRHRLAAVSVLHPRCALADAWATALMVVGPDEALDLARAQGIEVYVVMSTESDGFVDEMTEGFRRRLVSP